MNFTKPALSIPDQITLLKSRGLTIKNEELAKYNLANISYYRLSAYLLSFQKFGDQNHNYMPWASFERVVRLYVFDREFRLICLDAIERIEVAIRCRISQEYSMRYGNNWYEDSSLYTSQTNFRNTKRLIDQEISKSKEIFLLHYKGKYSSPVNPPSWMTLEVLPFGILSRMYKELKSNDAKKAVADYFGISPTILANWLENLSYVRNLCAHHSRLWNRTMTKRITVPTNPAYPWVNIASPKPEKLYNSICVMQFLQERVNVVSPFKGKLQTLFSRFHEINLTAAGFPSDWKTDLFWKPKYIPYTHVMRAVYFRCRKAVMFGKL